MSVFATAGAKISVGTPKSAVILADYTADVFTQVGEVEDLGEFGDDAEEITFASISDARKRKVKGVRDAGSFDLVCGRDPSDAGQIALRAAAAASPAYNFKVEFSDKPATGASPKNTVVYFKAQVLSARNKLGSVNDTTKQTFKISITTEILEVAASAT